MFGKTSKEMSELQIVQSGGDVTFFVKVVPGSSRTSIAGQLEGRLKVKVAAAPEKGKANECLIAFLAKRCRVKKKAVSIVSGTSSPVKQIKIANSNIEDIVRLLLGDGG